MMQCKSFLQSVLQCSEKASRFAKLIRQDEHLFELLVQEKTGSAANSRFTRDFKTLADVIIQETVRRDLLREYQGLKFFGEENNSFSNKSGKTIEVTLLDSVEGTKNLLSSVLDGDEVAALALATCAHEVVEVLDCAIEKISDFTLPKNMAIWIDPIDSTAQYISGSTSKSELDTCKGGIFSALVLIGAFEYDTGHPVLGVIHQPFFELKAKGQSSSENSWVSRCLWGVALNETAVTHFHNINLNKTNVESQLKEKLTVVISESEDEGVQAKLKKNFNLQFASGAGFKILEVITGLADAYVLSKSSTYLWDTCGPNAILNSMGGAIIRYQPALRAMEMNSEIEMKYLIEEFAIDYRVGCRGAESCKNLEGIVAVLSQEVLKKILVALLPPS